MVVRSCDTRSRQASSLLTELDSTLMIHKSVLWLLVSVGFFSLRSWQYDTTVGYSMLGHTSAAIVYNQASITKITKEMKDTIYIH